MKGRRKRGRFGTFLFALPIVLIGFVVAYQLISATYFNSGTLIVETQSSGRYYPAMTLSVSVSVDTSGGTTPLTLSLTQGTHTVVFPSVQWYSTPQQRTVSVLAGKSTYALGVYEPVLKVISIEGGQFNATTISIKHGVTPFVLINKMTSFASVQGAPIGTIIIQSAKNYTYVFQNSGTYTLTLFGTSAPNLTVAVG
ncbi:MAG TPA: hypothetical protein VGR53_08905 [Nitrososphaerales archaeon]|nr:hypothetical protein [Nitrososphaerales archaeon]